jgi:hypothetical protein
MRKRNPILFAGVVTCLFLTNVAVYGTHVEAKMLSFQPTEEAFKNIYGGGLSYGGEVDISIYKGLAVWFGAEYFTKTGETTFTREETTIRIFPFYGGLKYIFSGERMMPYLGAAVGYFQFKETSPIGEVKEGKIGFRAQGGLLLRLTGSWFVDFQVGYDMCKIKPQELDEVEIGGLKAGLAVAFTF